MNQSPDNVCPLFQRILYAFIYKANKRTLMDYLQKNSLKIEKDESYFLLSYYNFFVITT